jgi:secreted PhoX family phosphatase
MVKGTAMSDSVMRSADPDDDAATNPSNNPAFGSILEARLSRRDLLRGTASACALAVFSGVGVSVAGAEGRHGDRRRGLKLDFAAVPKNRDDLVTLPAGYRHRVLYRLGDPIVAGVPDYRNDGTDDPASFAFRSGDHHDGMSYFGLGRGGRRGPDSSDHGLLCMNHEAITPAYLHPTGPTIVGGARTNADEVLREVYAHGVSIIEVE